MPANELDFEPKPEFFKRGIDFVGIESGETFYCWYFWARGEWIKDRSFCDRHKKLLKLADWKQTQEVIQ
jgi:hypothetical protein